MLLCWLMDLFLGQNAVTLGFGKDVSRNLGWFFLVGKMAHVAKKNDFRSWRQILDLERDIRRRGLALAAAISVSRVLSFGRSWDRLSRSQFAIMPRADATWVELRKRRP
jgi:hypothetical protein